jgi:hypothetical protein
MFQVFHSREDTRILRSFRLWRLLMKLIGTKLHSLHFPGTPKAVGLIPSEVTGLFNSPNPSSRITTLGSTQPLTEMSTKYLPVGKWRPANE